MVQSAPSCLTAIVHDGYQETSTYEEFSEALLNATRFLHFVPECLHAPPYRPHERGDIQFVRRSSGVLRGRPAPLRHDGGAALGKHARRRQPILEYWFPQFLGSRPSNHELPFGLR